MEAGFLIDMDGVVYRGSELIPGADRFIARLQQLELPFLFLTNNSQWTRRDAVARLARLGIQRPLVVTDAGLLGTSSFRQLEQTLGASEKGSRWFLYSGVHPNPIEQDVAEAAQACQADKCDGIIAFGGGSPLDVGKAARLLVKRPGFKLADFYSEPDWSGLLPLVAIPTTAGTGSEVGRSSVVTLAATGRKAVLFHPELLAKLVILDPVLTRDLPPKLTAATLWPGKV